MAARADAIDARRAELAPGPRCAAAGHFTAKNELRGSNDGSLRGSRTCSAAPRWHDSQPMPSSTRCSRGTRRASPRSPAAASGASASRRCARARVSSADESPARVGHEPLGAALARQERVDDLALVGLRRRPGERAEHRREVRRACCGRRCTSGSTPARHGARAAPSPSPSSPCSEATARSPPAAARTPSSPAARAPRWLA